MGCDIGNVDRGRGLEKDLREIPREIYLGVARVLEKTRERKGERRNNNEDKKRVDEKDSELVVKK